MFGHFLRVTGRKQEHVPQGGQPLTYRIQCIWMQLHSCVIFCAKMLTSYVPCQNIPLSRQTGLFQGMRVTAQLFIVFGRDICGRCLCFTTCVVRHVSAGRRGNTYRLDELIANMAVSRNLRCSAHGRQVKEIRPVCAALGYHVYIAPWSYLLTSVQRFHRK